MSYNQDFSQPDQEQQNNPLFIRDRNMWAMLCHLSAFAGFVIPFGSIVGPLAIYLMKKDEFELVKDQGIEVINFQISMLLMIIIAALLCIILIGIPLLIGLVIYWIIATVIGAVKANEGIPYRYAINFRFVKMI